MTTKVREVGHLLRVTYDLVGFTKFITFLARLPLEGLRSREGLGRRAIGQVSLLINGRIQFFRHFDLGLGDEIIVKRTYEDDVLHMGPNDVVVDLGSNIGMFSLYASCFAERVVSVEPNPQNLQLLRENVKSCRTRNIDVVEGAVGNYSGLVPLNLIHSTASTIMERKGAGTVEVRSMTIRELLNSCGLSRIGFMKVDIEGAEFLLFSETSWLGDVKQLAVEVHTEYGDPKVILDVLLQRGFRIEQTNHTLTAIVVRAWKSDAAPSLHPMALASSEEIAGRGDLA